MNYGDNRIAIFDIRKTILQKLVNQDFYAQFSETLYTSIKKVGINVLKWEDNSTYIDVTTNITDRETAINDIGAMIITTTYSLMKNEMLELMSKYNLTNETLMRYIREAVPIMDFSVRPDQSITRIIFIQ